MRPDPPAPAGGRPAGRGARRRLAAPALVAAAVGALYALGCLLIVGAQWQRKEGELPPASRARGAAEEAFLLFPSGLLGDGLRALGVPRVEAASSLPAVALMNGAFWGAAAGWVAHRASRRPR